MIWTYIISILVAIIWFLIFRYLAVKEYSKSEYEFVKIARWMIIMSIIALCIPILNLIYMFTAPFILVYRLDEDNYDVRFMARENDAFSQKIKEFILWLRESAF